MAALARPEPAARLPFPGTLSIVGRQPFPDATRHSLMPRPALVFLALALAAAAHGAAARAQGDENPRAVVHAATRAVQRDSVAALRVRWDARLRADSADRAAALGLATLARLTYDYPAAERLYRRLLADSLRPDGYTALARLGLARGLEGRGFSVAARPHFERAREEARAAGDAATEGEVLLPLAFIRARTEGLTVGEALLDTADRLIPDTALVLRAQLGNRRAIILSLRGRPEALAAAESSIMLARRAGDVRAEADGFRTLGQVLVYRQEFDSALVVLRRAEELFRRARDRSALAAHMVWRAQALGNLGRYGEMREVMRLALTEGEAAHNPSAVAVAHRSLGALAVMLGDYTAAGDYLKKSAAISRATGDSLGVMTTRKFLADVALAAGDVAGARGLTLERLASARAMEDPRDQYEAHVMLAALAIRERDWAAAGRSLAEARAAIRDFPGAQYRLWLLHHEGRLAHARGDLDSAERAFTAFLRELGAESSTAEAGYDTHVRLADIHAARGDLARAEREMLKASDELDRWRAGLGDAELRVLAFQVSPSEHARAADPLEQDARTARVLAALARGGRPEAAFALAERRRARELRDRLVRAAGLRADTARARAAAPGAADSAVAVTAGEFDVQLPDDRTALLEYVGGVGGAPTTVFVVRRGGGIRARVLATPADSLGDRVARFAALLESGADAEPLARSLGAALLEPALAELGPGFTRLIVVPDGPLHHVPWDALRLADGRFVAQRYAVSIAPSAGVVAALWRRAPDAARSAARPMRLLAFGDPTFPGERAAGAATSAADEVYRSAFDSSGGLPRLRASADEARRVARYAPAAEVRLRERASAAYLKRAALDSFRIVHFATHALVDERTGARTALALAPGDGESGFVGAGDLAALTLGADLVVLSACRSARGRIVEGEGVQGLTAPLLQAGARSVVATHWRIGDRATVAFMDDFYAALARGLAVTDALRAAKVAAIARGAPAREWAAFATVGDPLVTTPLRMAAPPRGRMWVALALLLGAAGLAVYRLRTRGRRPADPH